MQKLAAGFVELNWLLIMLNSILLSAAMLLGGTSVSAREMMVEPQAMVAPVMTTSMLMSDATLTLLIETYATAKWNVTVETAWSLYRAQLLKITEIVPDVHYLLEYDGGILDVLLDDNGF